MSNPVTKKLKDGEESSTMDNPSEETQLSEEEKDEIRRENEAMQRVLEIPLVVEEVIDKLQLKDLKTCRRACSMWKEIATKVILKKDCSKVEITFDTKIGKFLKGNIQQVQEDHHLPELTKIIEKSNPFPSSNFIIYKGNLGDPELLDFFKTGGEGIKTLDLYSMNKTALNILVHCPNVETLRLDVLGSENTTVEQIEIPKLKIISVGLFSGFRFRNIISPNLQVIRDFNLVEDTTDVVKAGKIHTVKELRLYSVPSLSPPEKLQEFVNAGPQLEMLRFCNLWRRVDEDWRNNFAGSFRQLLDTCKDTLRVLEFNGLGYLFENMTLPRFSQVKELSLANLMGHGRLLPIRINLPETFPKLEVLNLYRANLREDENWDIYFPPPDAYIEQLTTVNKVQVNENCTQKCREMFQLMCPNARILN